MNMPKVGDKVWFVPGDNRRDGREITVTKIGKKYFYSDYTKFDIVTWEEVSDYSPGRCFINKDAYERMCAINEHRNELSRLIKYLSDDEVENIYQMLSNRKNK